MLRFFSVRNFRQFREELVFDFTNTRDYHFNSMCVKDGLINKAIIYGKNAVGKTSLMMAMQDIYFTTLGREAVNADYPYRNADSAEDETIQFHYIFVLDGALVDYQYEKTDYSHVVSEKLSFDDTVVFEYSRKKSFYCFDHVDVIGAEQLNWTAFQNMSIDDAGTELLGTLTALRFAYSNTVVGEGSLLKKLIAFITRMRFSIFPNTPMFYHSMKSMLNDLANSETDAVQQFQSFLNDFGIACKLIVLKEANGKKNIYFDHKTPLSFFENMSSGTMLLTKFYLQYMMSKPRPSFIFVDEFDAYYHFELSEKIMKLLETEFDCQVILTSNNTNLLSNSIMRPDCILILHDGKLTPICDTTSRELRQGHDLEKLYMSGEFDVM